MLKDLNSRFPDSVKAVTGCVCVFKCVFKALWCKLHLIYVVFHIHADEMLKAN